MLDFFLFAAGLAWGSFTAASDPDCYNVEGCFVWGT